MVDPENCRPIRGIEIVLDGLRNVGTSIHCLSSIWTPDNDGQVELHRRLVRPAFVPHSSRERPGDVRKRAGTAEATNPQVRDRIGASSQVAQPGPRTLSRWRHGFKSRWDYHRALV
jgi:hypothetical protein